MNKWVAEVEEENERLRVWGEGLEDGAEGRERDYAEGMRMLREEYGRKEGLYAGELAGLVEEIRGRDEQIAGN